MTDLKERDLKQLSAYLDGELNPKESARLEMRLKMDPHLQEALRELDETRKLIRSLPQVRPPRNFTLTPEMVGIQYKRSLYPVFRLATVVAAVALVMLIGADTFFMGGMTMMRASEEMPQAVEVALEEEAEILAEAPAAQEAQIESVGESELEAAGDMLGAEEPLASVAEGTETSKAEQVEVTATDVPVNGVAPFPEATPSPPSRLQPDIPPTLEAWIDPTEMLTSIPSPPPTSTFIPGDELGAQQREVDPIRTAEVGLGVLAAILAAVTFALRRQH